MQHNQKVVARSCCQHTCKHATMAHRSHHAPNWCSTCRVCLTQATLGCTPPPVVHGACRRMLRSTLTLQVTGRPPRWVSHTTGPAASSAATATAGRRRPRPARHPLRTWPGCCCQPSPHQQGRVSARRSQPWPLATTPCSASGIRQLAGFGWNGLRLGSVYSRCSAGSVCTGGHRGIHDCITPIADSVCAAAVGPLPCPLLFSAHPCSSASLPSLLSTLSTQSNLQYCSTTYGYSNDEQQQLQCKHQDQQAADSKQLADALDAVASSWHASGDSSSSGSRGSGTPADEAAAGEAGGSAEAANLAAVGGDGCVTLWFPRGGVYARLPLQLPGSAGTAKPVTFEVGALHE
ncbi:hypothetical protein COO60DRAFT_1082004 [Scenedesmus sp. NREL 46B-D3]|nr:hypothetical protein COO60DRAFT_1082004 [Scenedesmus sp. NREL 46B-D3]